MPAHRDIEMKVIAALAALTALVAIVIVSRPSNRLEAKNVTVEGSRPVPIDPTFPPGRAPRGDVTLLLPILSYKPAAAGDVQIVVRRRDTTPPRQIRRITIFPAEAFPSAERKGGQTYRVLLGRCEGPMDWACTPKLEVLLDAGSAGSTAGAAMTLGAVSLTTE